MAVLHGGVCHRASTPHKSGNEMKMKTIERKKKMQHVAYLEYCADAIFEPEHDHVAGSPHRGPRPFS